MTADRATGLSKQALYWRLNHGWPLVRAIVFPVRRWRSLERSAGRAILRRMPKKSPKSTAKKTAKKPAPKAKHDTKVALAAKARADAQQDHDAALAAKAKAEGVAETLAMVGGWLEKQGHPELGRAVAQGTF